MRKTLAALALLALTSCHPWFFHPVDPETRGWDHRSKIHTTFVQIAPNQQICVPWREKTAKVTLIVIPKHPGLVKMVLDDDHIYRLKGESVELVLAKVSPGQYHMDIYLDEEFQLTVSWSVWDCGPAPTHDQNLYKPDGSGLKGYCTCEEKPCTTQE